FSKSTSVTQSNTSNDFSKPVTLNVKYVSAMCDKCVMIDKHDLCVLKSVNGVMSRTQMPIVVPVSTREPKCTVKHFVANPLKKIVASESNQKPRNITRKLYERVKIVIFFVDSGCSKHMTGNLKLLINFVEKFLGTVKFRNDQIAPILGYGDLVQGVVMIKRVYYVEGLKHNLFSVGQFCDADLEVAFRKSTCYIRDLKGNDLITATSSQAWLWHWRLSHLNFDTNNLLSKNDIVVGLSKLKFVKDHLCSSYELWKAKRKSFHTKTTPSSKRRLQLLHMDLCGPIPQLKRNPMEDIVMLNNSKGKKQEVEDQRRNVKLSKNKTSVTACNDSLNAKTLNVNFVCATCGKCVLNEKHDMCVLKSVNGVISRTKMPIDVPVSTREPKCTVKQSVAKPLKKTIASEFNQKPKNITKKLYERISKACSWWYPKFTPSGYKWKPKSEKENVNPNVSMPLGTVSRTANILEHTTSRRSTVSNTSLSSNYFAARRDCPIHR
nr:hypothetical protein [Tanacetum cinerariifolium]